MSQRLIGPEAKIERANKHIRDLEASVQRFRDSDPYAIFTEDDPKTGDLIYRVRQLKEPPVVCWSLIIGDAIHNLRSALDLLYCQLVEAHGNTPDKHDTFPISDDGQQFECLLKGKVSKRIDATALKILEATQPYPGGNRAYWVLHRVDIADKHRLLLTVAAAYGKEVGTIPLGWRRGELVQRSPELGLTRVERFFPLEDGIEIRRVRAVDRLAQEEHDDDFTVGVAFGEQEGVYGEPVLPTLLQLMSLVQDTLKLFVTCL